MPANGDQPEWVLRIQVAERADHAAFLVWMRRWVIPAYFQAPEGVTLEIRASDSPDE